MGCGNIIPLDASGRPSFQILENGASNLTIIDSVFDLMLVSERHVTDETLGSLRAARTRNSAEADLADQVFPGTIRKRCTASFQNSDGVRHLLDI